MEWSVILVVILLFLLLYCSSLGVLVIVIFKISIVYGDVCCYYSRCSCSFCMVCSSCLFFVSGQPMGQSVIVIVVVIVIVGAIVMAVVIAIAVVIVIVIISSQCFA